ncbi:hypothetical protein F7725_010789 [Dissostichus mawsoni]|uniref:Uncharacterized protein n=1 Tax=Dissostichus mawsoni TaxID=36200 RepID=A0A7J5ZB42_DISMA|nr:hypothetical protein F7725_010789 [Dissostichus mawsoni]
MRGAEGDLEERSGAVLREQRETFSGQESSLKKRCGEALKDIVRLLERLGSHGAGNMKTNTEQELELDPRWTSEVELDSLWTSEVELDSLWTSEVEQDSILSSEVEFDPVELDPLWTSEVELDPLWTSEVEQDSLWTSEVEQDSLWTSEVELDPLWTCRMELSRLSPWTWGTEVHRTRSLLTHSPVTVSPLHHNSNQGQFRPAPTRTASTGAAGVFAGADGGREGEKLRAPPMLPLLQEEASMKQAASWLLLPSCSLSPNTCTHRGGVSEELTSCPQLHVSTLCIRGDQGRTGEIRETGEQVRTGEIRGEQVRSVETGEIRGLQGRSGENRVDPVVLDGVIGPGI